jgi:hypothetical protein
MTMTKCEHDINERECAVTADGMCPLCLAAEIERLRALLKGVAEYCSGDDRTLGAIKRLATIRNTVDRALINHEQRASDDT